MGKELTTEEFVTQSKIVHGDKYSYDDVIYINSRTKVKIFCKSCNKIFSQLPMRHLHGNGCKTCSNLHLSKSRTFTTEEFIFKSKAIHKDNYDYTNVEYVNAYTKINIKCNTCNTTFMQNPNNHLLGKGCKRCAISNLAKNKLISKDVFIDRCLQIHNGIYDYSNITYTNMTTKISIYCKHCNEYFEQLPSSHLQGVGCPVCKLSKGERSIKYILNTLNIKYIPQYKFDDCRNKLPLPFDFYLPERNICIEYDGKLHFTPIEYFGGVEHFNTTKFNDNIKTIYCHDNNIKLLRIPYTEFNNIEDILKRELI